MDSLYNETLINQNKTSIDGTFFVTFSPFQKYFPGQKVLWTNLVKPEEAVIVILVLIIWIGTIFLFIHKWGKIRGIEPYAPAFERTLTSTLPISKQVEISRRNSSLIHELNINIRRKSAAFVDENSARRPLTVINIENEHGESIPLPTIKIQQHQPLLAAKSCETLAM